MSETASDHTEVLVAILNEERDLELLQREGWYRIPVDKTPKAWPPQALAFYQTKAFQENATQVRYFGRVASICQVVRRDLFPDEPLNAKSNRVYHQVFLDQLLERSTPIISRRPRRIVFVSTTWPKFAAAREFNDLFDESPLEDLLWTELQQHGIPAERQWWEQVGKRRYALDFAIFCNAGQINVEADGDTYHTGREAVARDKERRNALGTTGWRILNFNGHDLRERMTDYCIPHVQDMIEKLDGLQDDRPVPRPYQPPPPGPIYQLSFFEAGPGYDLD